MLPWHGEGAQSIEGIERRFRVLGNRAAIVGPHGTGKSTLLEQLVPRLGGLRIRRSVDGIAQVENETGEVIWLSLRRPVGPLQLAEQWSRCRLLVVDGMEQLSWLLRYWLIAKTRFHGIGLLVTSHAPVPFLPLLYQSELTRDQVTELVQSAMADRPDIGVALKDKLLSASNLDHCFDAERGNLREIFMRLYDDFESCRRSNNPSLSGSPAGGNQELGNLLVGSDAKN